MIIAVGVYSKASGAERAAAPQEQGDEETCDDWRQPHAGIHDGKQQLASGEAAHGNQHADR